MEVYKRIRELRKKHLKMSMEAFGSRLGVSRDIIANIELNRLARPDQKLSLIKLICKEFSVNEDWLLNGNEPMFVEPYTFSLDEFARRKGATELEMQIVKTYFDLDPGIREMLITHFRKGLSFSSSSVPTAVSFSEEAEKENNNEREIQNNPIIRRVFAYYGKIAAAGKNFDLYDIIERTKEYPLNDLNRHADFVIGVSGDSMEPTFYDGDIVYVEKTTEINIGDIGIFQKDGCLYIKEAGEQGLISHNPKYGPMIDDGDVRCIGKVLGKAENEES